MDQLFNLFVSPSMELVDDEHKVHAEEYKRWLQTNFLNRSQLDKVEDYYFLPGFNEDPTRYAYDKFEYRSNDILVSTHPKTGTTWMSTIVQNIVYGRQPELLAKAAKFSQFFTYLEFGPASKYRVTENVPLPRRILGTHLPASLVNLEKLRQRGVKIIYVLRNPKDRAVSFYNFVMSLPLMKVPDTTPIFPKDEKEFYDKCFSEGKPKHITSVIDDYLQGLKDWNKHKNDENVLFVAYEQLKKNPHAEVKKIAEFLGETLDDAEISNVVEKTSFQKMKEKAEEGGIQGAEKLFRKGQVGEWKDHLTVAQSELVDQKVKEFLGDTDIKFIYE